MMTIEEFRKIPDGFLMASGELPNSPEGLFMTRENEGKMLRWVAKKGHADDWCVYVHWNDRSERWVMLHGDKLHREKDIQMCVPCDDEVFQRYRR